MLQKYGRQQVQISKYGKEDHKNTRKLKIQGGRYETKKDGKGGLKKKEGEKSENEKWWTGSPTL